MCVGAGGVGEVWMAPTKVKKKKKEEEETGDQCGSSSSLPFFLTWRPAQAWWVAKTHPLLYLISLTFLLSVPLENSVTMVPPGGEPFDAGFVVTRSLHQFLKRRPVVNDLLAAANTVSTPQSPNLKPLFETLSKTVLKMDNSPESKQRSR